MLDTSQKIMSQEQAVALARTAQAEGKKVVFTNGCFDLLHAGHVDLLNRARSLGDLLVLGLNSDEGVRAQNKGPERPIVPQAQRAAVVAGLQAVDAVVFFEEPTPAKLIEAIAPDVLVKGGDWPEEKIVGAAFVRSHGGQVHSLPLVPGLSTTSLVSKLKTSRP
ncbi:MAG: D-glycero-beta-D-manno-heptose 1-phosphate adenylyltransferase [Desulfarculaceae bacterium]|nr:D-glycero-beta-D-manno-heptose 1-phosphate adenylyltransferase [Desulfarculaceae bacterium]MCF8097747.1 D-glycero-beta-D-manno-heptose 1-phosphate adenylyltransferase [Desulfarculaceae bacterium]MCF8123173.1 D-glycero-beta-D-manno-heptose 1-phosphate adenylyltransferase [Desulfarculaceae bacterium]